MMTMKKMNERLEQAYVLTGIQKDMLEEMERHFQLATAGKGYLEETIYFGTIQMDWEIIGGNHGIRNFLFEHLNEIERIVQQENLAPTMEGYLFNFANIVHEAIEYNAKLLIKMMERIEKEELE